MFVHESGLRRAQGTKNEILFPQRPTKFGGKPFADVVRHLVQVVQPPKNIKLSLLVRTWTGTGRVEQYLTICFTICLCMSPDLLS